MAIIEASISGDAQVVARLGTLSQRMRETLVASTQRQWFRVQAEVVTSKLSGDPLHRRTGVLASSINVGAASTATAFEQSPATITGRVGTRVRYGRVYEDGGSFEIPAHQRKLTMVFGRPVAAREVSVRAHSATFPKRAFLRPTLEDMRSSILDAIESDIDQALSGEGD